MWRHTKPAPETDACDNDVLREVSAHFRSEGLNQPRYMSATRRRYLFLADRLDVLAVEVERGQAITRAAEAVVDVDRRGADWSTIEHRWDELVAAVDAYRVGVGDTPQPTTDAT